MVRKLLKLKKAKYYRESLKTLLINGPNLTWVEKSKIFVECPTLTFRVKTSLRLKQKYLADILFLLKVLRLFRPGSKNKARDRSFQICKNSVKHVENIAKCQFTDYKTNTNDQ